MNPLFSRIDTACSSLEKGIEVVEDISGKYKNLSNIILVYDNHQITRLIPMLISKIIYIEQKKIVAGNDVTKTKHLIIDGSQNILNADYRNNGEIGKITGFQFLKKK